MRQYDEGYEAAASGLPYDKNACEAWKAGYNKFEYEMQLSENVRFM